MKTQSKRAVRYESYHCGPGEIGPDFIAEQSRSKIDLKMHMQAVMYSLTTDSDLSASTSRIDNQIMMIFFCNCKYKQAYLQAPLTIVSGRGWTSNGNRRSWTELIYHLRMPEPPSHASIVVLEDIIQMVTRHNG